MVKVFHSEFSICAFRPALIISNNEYNQNNLDALAITLNLSAQPYKIIIENQDLERGNLPVKSAIGVDKPFSVLVLKHLFTASRIITAV